MSASGEAADAAGADAEEAAARRSTAGADGEAEAPPPPFAVEAWAERPSLTSEAGGPPWDDAEAGSMFEDLLLAAQGSNWHCLDASDASLPGNLTEQAPPAAPVVVFLADLDAPGLAAAALRRWRQLGHGRRGGGSADVWGAPGAEADGGAAMGFGGADGAGDETMVVAVIGCATGLPEDQRPILELRDTLCQVGADDVVWKPCSGGPNALRMEILVSITRIRENRRREAEMRESMEDAYVEMLRQKLSDMDMGLGLFPMQEDGRPCGHRRMPESERRTFDARCDSSVPPPQPDM